ncbi:MAG: hypothetical protein GTN74_15025, partial [Proteobacteria bacterium]|nr:hypothetical protein [Pseudomonadota bacterium]NIS71937.1 hypothetical protein [Pseudomonadota bacterium]
MAGVPDEEWGEAVKALMVPEDGQKATEEKVTTLCKENMAHYKALKSVDFMGELAKTGAGKI